MAIAFGAGVHSLASTATEAGGHVARATLSYLWNQAENGTGCPTGMAYAGLAALCHLPVIGAGWRAKVGSTAYDPRYLPLDQKEGATIGFAMTEKQAGSDLRRVATSATPTGDGAYLLRGHKWFCSAPMSDGIFTLASTPAGPSCFLVPRWLPDGARNPLLVMRLKDKCGNRSNASAEIEYNDTVAWLVGEEGAGIRTILEAAHLTRLDFAVGSAGLVRHALVLAIHHARNRQAFGSRLVDLPLHANVLADLALESEANLVLALRVARATDRAVSDESERLLARIGTPIAKYWNAKRAPQAVAEALECLGGNGYVEDGPMARLYREAPLNGIWEGTSNMMTLDALRANRSDPATFDALLAELAPAAGADRRFDRGLDRLRQELGAAPSDERGARRLAGLRPATHLTVVRFRTVSSCPARS
jgi:putative acyl-CoA dehydrogenase